MNQDPLTFRYARTLRELDADPRAWWTSAKAAAAEDEHIRAEFNGDDDDDDDDDLPFLKHARRDLCTAAILIAIAVAIGALAYIVGVLR